MKSVNRLHKIKYTRYCVVMAGRPAKPNKIRVQLKIDAVALTAADEAANLLTAGDRSQLIEDVLVAYLPRHVAKHARPSNVKPAKKPRR